MSPVPADSLKIDRAFVAALGADRQGDAVAGGIVLLARSLGMAPVAEGVETAEQARHLAELGCEQVQGFHFSRPVPADAISAQLRGDGGTLPAHPSRDNASPNPRRVTARRAGAAAEMSCAGGCVSPA